MVAAPIRPAQGQRFAPCLPAQTARREWSIRIMRCFLSHASINCTSRESSYFTTRRSTTLQCMARRFPKLRFVWCCSAIATARSTACCSSSRPPRSRGCANLRLLRRPARPGSVWPGCAATRCSRQRNTSTGWGARCSRSGRSCVTCFSARLPRAEPDTIDAGIIALRELSNSILLISPCRSAGVRCGGLPRRSRRDAAALAARLQRGGNTKTHGVVRASFTVRDDLPPQYRRGLFAEPKTYLACYRSTGRWATRAARGAGCIGNCRSYVRR